MGINEVTKGHKRKRPDPLFLAPVLDILGEKMEPAVGIEPTTCRLRIDCTTTVLRRQEKEGKDAEVIIAKEGIRGKPFRGLPRRSLRENARQFFAGRTPFQGVTFPARTPILSRLVSNPSFRTFRRWTPGAMSRARGVTP